VDPGIVEGAEDLDEGVLIGANSRNSAVQLFSKELVKRHHARDDHILKLATQLTLQIFQQILKFY
jgi:hypothetical protein